MGIVVIKGQMTFHGEQDWKAVEAAGALFSKEYTDIKMSRAKDQGDGTYVVPFVMKFSAQGRCPEWLDDLRAEARRKGHIDDFRELLATYNLEEMTRLFMCDVEADTVEVSISDPETLELVNREGGRSYLRGPRGAALAPGEFDESDEPEEHEVPTLDEALAKLDALIGLESVKRQIHDIVAIVQNRGVDALPCMHMVFTGNPGTGKTEVARIVGQVLSALGVIKTGKFVETDRSGLVGQFVGHTAQKTLDCVRKAKGGVLFIDEAYALGLYAGGDLGSGPEGGRRVDFGEEAISTLVKEMEDRRGEFVCIMAGYPREMERMISVNPGMRDRVGFTIDFPDYDAAELSEIFEFMVQQRGYEMSPEASSLVGELMAQVVTGKGHDFSNARLVRKAVERSIFKQNVRTSGYQLECCDIEAAFEDNDLASLVSYTPAPTFGFAAAAA